MSDFWSDMLQQQKNSVPAVREDESRQALETLERDYGIMMRPIDPAELERGDFQALPADSLARLSGVLQQVPGLIAGQSLQNAYQNTYANAYRLLIPNGSENLSFMKNSQLAGEFGDGAIDPTLVDSGGTIRRKAGVEKIASPDVRAQQIAYLAFSAASLVTNQYFLQRIDKKLESIQQTTKEILQFLELDKRTKLQARGETLERIHKNLFFILQKCDERAAELINIKRIRQESRSDVLFYQERAQAISATVTEKMKKTELREKLESMMSNLFNCWTALCMESLSVLLELVLLNDRSHDRLESERQELIRKYDSHMTCCHQCEEAVKRSSVNGNLPVLIPGALVAGGALGAVLSSLLLTLPAALIAGSVVGLADAAGSIKAEEQIKNSLARNMGGKNLEDIIRGWDPKLIMGITDSIALLDRVVNNPIELAISGEQAYIRLPDSQKDESLTGG